MMIKIYSLIFGIMLLVFLSVTTVLADTQIGVIQSLPPVKHYVCSTL